MRSASVDIPSWREVRERVPLRRHERNSGPEVIEPDWGQILVTHQAKSAVKYV